MNKKFVVLKLMIFLSLIPILLLVFAFYKKKTPEGEINPTFTPISSTSYSVTTIDKENNQKRIALSNENGNFCVNTKTQSFSNFVELLNLSPVEKEKLLVNFEAGKVKLKNRKKQKESSIEYYFSFLWKWKTSLTITTLSSVAGIGYYWIVTKLKNNLNNVVKPTNQPKFGPILEL